jgi:glycosyltransferase involved in cell wall biosynthesis
MSRICILTSVHRPFDIRIFHKQARSLVEGGHDVTLITQEGESQLVDGVRLIALPQPRSRVQRMLGTWRLLRVAFQERADLYHFHDPELIPVGLVLKLLAGKPLVYDVHEDYPKYILIKHWLPKGIRRLTAAAFWMIEHFACLFFDAIVAATDDIAGNFRSYGQKVVVVKNYPLTVDVPQRQRPLGRQEPAVLVYIGTLSTATGVPQMTKALEHLECDCDVRFRLLGQFAGDGCRQQVEASDHKGQVEYLGWLSQPEVLEHLSRADIGLACLQPVPQFLTSEPNKIFEYMRSGLPIVASNFPLWRRIVEGAHCGVVVDPKSPEAIGRAISKLLANPERMRSMADSGQQAVRQIYNWDSQKTVLLDLYADIVR